LEAGALMVNITRPADKKPLEADGRFKLEWDALFSLLVAAVNAVSQNGLVAPKAYTVATVPSAAENTGHMIYVSDAIGGGIPAFSDGAIWLRVDTRTIVL
jgi:hypothetical protein